MGVTLLVVTNTGKNSTGPAPKDDLKFRKVYQMSREAVLTIRETEEKAARIRREAAELAKKQMADARRQGEADCERAEAETRAEIRDKLAGVRQQAAELLERSAAEAGARADEISAAAGSRIAMAEDIIIRELVEKCR